MALLRLAAPLALMAAIWAASSDPSPGPDLGGLQVAASYVAHLGLYAALWVLVAWALRWRWPGPAFLVTVAYGAVDELHQSTVPGRHATLADLAVDALGAGLAWLLWTRLRRRRAAGGPGRLAPAGTPTRQESR